MKALEASFKATRSETRRLERENAQLEVERQRLEMVNLQSPAARHRTDETLQHTSNTTPSSKLRNLEKQVTDLTKRLGDSCKVNVLHVDSLIITYAISRKTKD